LEKNFLEVIAALAARMYRARGHKNKKWVEVQRCYLTMNNEHSFADLLTKPVKALLDSDSCTIDQTFTYQTRLSNHEENFSALEEYATLYGSIERSLFEDLKRHDLNFVKQLYLACFGITARQFNAIRISLEGKIESATQSLIANIERLQETIAALSKKLPKIKNPLVKHEKGRLIGRLKDKLKAFEEKLKNGKVSICFGGKKLFHAQFALEENGYASKEEWLEDWQAARNSEFFCLGSKDETAGNQSCVAMIDVNGNLTLRLRLPNDLVKKHGKYITFSGVFFKYGHEEILKALASGQAVSYRFKKDEKGWRVFASCKQQSAPIVTNQAKGAIGIDINANHIALVEIDHNGNPIFKETIPTNTYGKTKEQAEAIIGDACKRVVILAKEKGKSVILEQLDFTKKKTTLKGTSPKYARMLSSFSYCRIIQGITSKAFREGVAIFFVNPAMTSIIGKMKFAMRYGMSNHHAAALCIARRHYRFSEAPSKSPMKMCYKNCHVTIPSPVRKKGEHVWKFWKRVERELQTVLAELRRAYRSPCPH
jgi:IS605 OrfB family transposase